jgi:hypothetical protein
VIVNISIKYPNLYQIAEIDKLKNVLPRKYYEQELKKPKIDDLYFIDQVFKRTKDKILVSFLGYRGKKYWIKE